MYKRILVPVDGSATSDRALDTAIAMAQAFHSKLRLVFVVEVAFSMSANDMYGGFSQEVFDALREGGEQVVGRGVKTALAAGVEADSMVFDKFGQRLGDTIAEAATQWEADLIVVGTHGRHGIGRVVLGSGAEQIIRLAPVPVLAVRAAAEPAPAP